MRFCRACLSAPAPQERSEPLARFLVAGTHRKVGEQGAPVFSRDLDQARGRFDGARREPAEELQTDAQRFLHFSNHATYEILEYGTTLGERIAAARTATPLRLVRISF